MFQIDAQEPRVPQNVNDADSQVSKWFQMEWEIFFLYVLILYLSSETKQVERKWCRYVVSVGSGEASVMLKVLMACCCRHNSQPGSSLCLAEI